MKYVIKADSQGAYECWLYEEDMELIKEGLTLLREHTEAFTPLAETKLGNVMNLIRLFA